MTRSAFLTPRALLSIAAAPLLFVLLGSCGSGEPGEENGNGPDNGEDIELSVDVVVPSSGPEEGGTDVRLEGEGFLDGVADDPVSASLVTAARFGEIPAVDVEVVSDTIMRVVTPPGLLGAVSVVVENPNGTASCVACFEYVEDDDEENDFEVRIDRVGPVRGPADGGTRVRIDGRGFLLGFAELGEDVRDRTAILFGDNTAVDFDVIDDGLIDVVAPPGNVGDRDVHVQNPNGEAVCEGCFHYFVPVESAQISPSESPLEGGVEVTLTGGGFTEDTLVNVGGSPAIAPSLVDDETIVFFTPPTREPGAVDVEVLNENGRDTLRRRLVYFEQPLIEKVDPPVGSFEGGTTVRLEGDGLLGADSVSFGGVEAEELFSSGQDLFATTPPGDAGTVVDVEVSHPHGEAVLTSGFAYVDTAMRDPTLLSVFPPFGRLEGGEEVVLVGTGLDHAGSQVRFGSVDSEHVTKIDAWRIAAVVPEATGGPGPVDVQIRNERGGALLVDGYTYLRGLDLDLLEPSSGPSAGGTAITLEGAGFDDDVEVRVGALPTTEVTVLDSGTLTAVTPPGGAGAVDVVVERVGDWPRARAVLPSAFSYEQPLSLAQVDPERGSQAGGTYVFLSGTGFDDDAEVRFGDAPAVVEDRIGTGTLAVRSPPGASGLVDVSVTKGGEEAERRGAFEYYDPTSIRGGASGGPIAGTINVTVLDRYTRSPLPEAHVMLDTDPDTPFQGETDLRGQITFSHPSLVKAVQVTATREGYDAVTVARIDARNLTVFLTPTSFEPDPSDPTEMPPPAPVAFINPLPGSGRVCGFKLPPDRELGHNQWEEARIYTTRRTVTSYPPFTSLSTPYRITQDCGEFGMPSRPGSVALYAKYGVVTQEVDEATGQASESFEPLLMGVTRGIEVPTIRPPVCTVNQACPTGFTCDGEEDLDPSNPSSFRWCVCDSDAACGEGKICNAAGGCQEPISVDIVLSMHLDVDVPISLINAPEPPDGAERVDSTHAYLELGGEGIVYISDALNVDESHFVMEGLPRLPGDGFVFVNMSSVGGGLPLSVSYRREIGELSSGVGIGPMQPMTRTIRPADGVLTGDRIKWSYEGEPIPDIVMLEVSDPGFSPMPIWSVILPGTESSVAVPPAVMERMRDGDLLQLFIVTALSPRFDFNHFSYRQLGLGSWNSFTQAADYFMVP